MADDRTQAPILIVDDDPAILAAIADVLRMDGYPVETAANGAVALERMERTMPSLILLDMRMPVLDGWGFAREMRRRGSHPAVVVMTAAHDAAVWAREIAADGFLPKPFEIRELLAVVERHLAPLGGEA